MFVGVEGEYLFDISVGDIKNILNPNYNLEVTIREYAGNVVPQFEIMFEPRRGETPVGCKCPRAGP